MQDPFFAAADAARAGTITLAEFADAAGQKWRRWGARFERRYKLPTWFSREDVEQELAISMWRFWGQYDPGRGVALGHYLEWNAVKLTAKVVSKARGVNQHRRRGPGRPEIVTSAVSDEVLSAAEPREEATQEDFVDRLAVYNELRRRVGARAPVLDAIVMADGQVDAASAALYADPRLRLEHRMASPRDAASLVRQTIETLATEVAS